MPFNRAKLLVEKAFEEEEKRELWEMWLTRLPWMTKDNYVSFSDYYKQSTTPPSTTPKEDILSMVGDIRKKVNERDGNI